MSQKAHAAEPFIHKDMLIQYLEKGIKPRASWRIGTEHEKFVYRLSDYAPLSYEGNPEFAKCRKSYKGSAGCQCWKRIILLR